MSISSENSAAGVSSAMALMLGLLDSTAEQFILSKDFKTTFETCQTALEKIANSDLEDERSDELKAGFCILAIQALAELNEWRCVLPWILQQYDQEQIPARILQMCILLYTKVGEAGLMLDVARVWLHCVTNSRAPEYGTILELYLLYILVPLGRIEEARELIQGRVGLCALTEEQRRTALDILEQTELQNELPSIPTPNSETLTAKPPGAALNKLGALLKCLYRKLLVTSSGRFQVHRLFLMALLVFMLFVRLDPAHPSAFMWIATLHQQLRQMWTALFAPYYHASRK